MNESNMSNKQTISATKNNLALAISSALLMSACNQVVPVAAHRPSVQVASNMTTGNWAYDQQAGINAFLNAQYNYCDAKMLAAYWKKPIAETKASAGDKILMGERQRVDDSLVLARAQAQTSGTPSCGSAPTPQISQNPPISTQDRGLIKAFKNSRYTYKDAAALARYWDKSSPWEAKLEMGRLIMQGQDDQIRYSLQGAGAFKENKIRTK